MAAVSQGAARKKSSDLAVRAYMHASILAITDLSTINPDRLRLALNYSTFLYDTAEETDQACFIAKRAIDDAQAEVDSLETDVHPESIRVIQLLRKRNVSRLLVILTLQSISLTTALGLGW
jgi:14-3-3 protein epsilon